MQPKRTAFRLISERLVDRALQHRAKFFWVSMVVVALGIASLGIRGLNLSMDFTGGASAVFSFQSPVTDEALRGALKTTRFKDAQVQRLGTGSSYEILLPGEELGEERTQLLTSTLQKLDSTASLDSVNRIGSAIGSELKTLGSLAFFASVLLIALYLSFRFQWKFAIGAMISLLHDTFFVLGIFSVFKIEFDLTTLAAVLAVLGYSVNDTIVVYDRIREEFRTRTQGDYESIFHHSVIAVLGRTVMTTGTTLAVTLALLFFGGKSLFGFALALTIGVAAGTYSTTFVAIHLLSLLKLKRADIVPDPKRKERLNAQP